MSQPVVDQTLPETGNETPTIETVDIALRSTFPFHPTTAIDELPRPLLQKTLFLPSGETVYVTLDTELSTKTSKIGDRFTVSISRDVMFEDTIAVPKDTNGVGAVTFVTDNGGFGKPGIIGIALRYLEIDGKLGSVSV